MKCTKLDKLLKKGMFDSFWFLSECILISAFMVLRPRLSSSKCIKCQCVSLLLLRTNYLTLRCNNYRPMSSTTLHSSCDAVLMTMPQFALCSILCAESKLCSQALHLEQFVTLCRITKCCHRKR